jgi:outer membrane lipoprotein-sorting protein
MSAARRPAGRRKAWLLVAAATAVVAVTGLFARGASADPVLPPLSPSELLTRVAQARVDGMSATFEQRSDLGLPSLPASASDTDDLQSVLALVSGNHTVRVWTAGSSQSKVALVDGSTETAAIRNGDQFWLWSSAKQQARHATLTSRAAPSPAPSPLSPTEAVSRLLDAVEPTTDVTTSGTGTVAGRPVYQLVLTPKDRGSLVEQVRVSVDAQEFVPLGLRVIAADGSDAITVSATSVDFSRPDESVFAFTPPPGAEVSELTRPTTGERPSKGGPTPTLTGSGWTTVAVTNLDLSTADQMVTALRESLPEVSGSWGHGRLLTTTLLTAVIADDGRVAVGSVVPERLYAALARK